MGHPLSLGDKVPGGREGGQEERRKSVAVHTKQIRGKGRDFGRGRGKGEGRRGGETLTYRSLKALGATTMGTTLDTFIPNFCRQSSFSGLLVIS